MKGIDRPQKSASPPTDVDEKKAAFKQAAEELLGPDPRTTAYLQNEESGLAEEEQNAAEFYKQRFQEAQAQLDQVGQMHQQTQDQAAQLQQQVEQNQMALTSAQSQAQQATSMAMQQVMQAGDDKIQQQMQAAQMRMAFQQLRGQLMDIASQEPPPAALNDPMGQAQGAGTTIDPVSGQPVQGQDPAAAGVSQPQPADATASGATPAPQESETQATPAAPDAPKPAEKEDKGGTSVTVKHGAFMQHALGAGIGAALGGAGTALESSRHGDGLREGLRNRVAKLEQEEGSFPQALRLVASKGLLQMSEAAKEHPVGATIMGSLMGAGMGAATEPAIRSLVDSGKRLMG
jgi:hypothetical protein